jgi:hypothetical protein
VPYFFTPDQEASFALMKANSDPAYHAIAALNAQFRHNEHLNPKDALNYVHGKHRPSRSLQAFLHGSPPTTKRPRINDCIAGPLRETGSLCVVIVET